MSRHECPECTGNPDGTVLVKGVLIAATCDFCRGCGSVSQEKFDWWCLGNYMRTTRISQGRTLRAEAERRGMSMTELSRMEQGVIEPVEDRTAFYVEHGFWPGEAPREPDDIADAGGH